MIATDYLDFNTRIDEVLDITADVQSALQGSGLKKGLVTIFVLGSTGAVTTIEHEDGLISDMSDALQRLAPKDIEYAHNQRWHDGNGHSHIRASLIGPCLSVPFNGGKLMLGTWQQIVFLELDCRGRQRRVVLQIMGE
jgi:secondary thiamine-phosphate synthase enzyme